MKLSIIFFSILFLNTVYKKVPAQTTSDTFLIEKTKIDSVVQKINVSYEPKFFIARLEGNDKDGECTAVVFFKPESDVFQKITLSYKDTILNRDVYYNKDVLLRVDFKESKYYNMSGRMVNQDCILLKRTISDELVDFGTNLIKMVKLLL